MIDPWFPKNFKISQRLSLGNVRFAGGGWQIYANAGNDGFGFGETVLVATKEQMESWISCGLIVRESISSVSFAGKEYAFVESGSDLLITPIDESPDFMTDELGLSFSIAMKRSRECVANARLMHGVFLERFSCILPSNDVEETCSDDLLLGAWLSCGACIPASQTERILQLSPCLSNAGLVRILEVAGISPPKSTQTKKDLDSAGILPENVETDCADGDKPSVKMPFSLPGRFELETFFREHIIDIVENAEDYRVMGIDFPSAFILQGPPGCGKTFAVEKLVDYLGWKSFSIDSGSVGSPYIHATSKKVAEVFEQAVDAAPSVVIIDEMEAFLRSRNGDGASGGHHIEEVAEFLRKIPEAGKKRVLVIAMTNMISTIDEAIRRKGRFDHILEVGMPSAIEIEQVLLHGFVKLPHDKTIDFKKASELLIGRPMSDIAFVLKESARLTARAHEKAIREETLMAVIDGLEKPSSSVNTVRIGF